MIEKKWLKEFLKSNTICNTHYRLWTNQQVILNNCFSFRILGVIVIYYSLCMDVLKRWLSVDFKITHVMLVGYMPH